jgi:hypothetical protein
MKFDVMVELTEVTPPEAIGATVSDSALGLGGRLTSTAQLRLESIDASDTRVTHLNTR